jgi:hypothetical protein
MLLRTHKPRFAALLTLALPLSATGTIVAPIALTARPALAAAQTPEGLEAAPTSRVVAALALPEGAFRATGSEHVAQFTDALNNLANLNKGRVSRVEVVIWRGDDAPKRALPGLLKKAGYSYAPQPTAETDAGKATLFSSAHDSKKNDLLGLWMEQKGAILLAWGVFTPDAAAAAADEDDAPVPAPKATPRRSSGNEDDGAPAPAPGAIVNNLDADAQVVNVMGRTMPRIPAFPKLAPKPGFVRGYVYDANGKPLPGARLGVRSTAAGGFYSGAQGKADAKGYYEIAVPWGAAHFYNAGYATDYGEGRAALGLHPADGEADGFASNVGEVENFVLLPYGIGDRDGVQENPRYSGNYYGGTMVLSWNVDDDPRWPDPKKLPPGTQFEVTLTPDGPLVDGSRGRTIVIRKPATHNVGFLGQLYVNNIPVGSYRITAKLLGGGALKMKETRHGGSAFGIAPKEATGTATLLLRPSSAKADGVPARHSQWEHLSITLERP